MRLDHLQTFARLRGLDGRGEKLDVVGRLLDEGWKPSDMPEREEIDVSDAAQSLVEAIHYRRLRDTAHAYGLSSAGTKLEIAERVVRHEEWIKERGLPPMFRKKRIAMASRVNSKAKKRYRPTGACAPIEARREWISFQFDRRRLDNVLRKERQYGKASLGRDLRQGPKMGLAIWFVEEDLDLEGHLAVPSQRYSESSGRVHADD